MQKFAQELYSIRLAYTIGVFSKEYARNKFRNLYAHTFGVFSGIYREMFVCNFEEYFWKTDVMITVKQLVENLGVDYAQICNIADTTFRGVVCNQNALVERYEYDEVDNAVYIWIKED